MTRAGIRVPVAAIVLAAVVLVWFYYTGLYCSDDTRYLIGAIKIASGETLSTASVAERRVVFLLPAATVYSLTGSLGPSVAAYGLFLAGIGVVAFLIARRLLSPAMATASALLALAQPVLFLYSGALLPDLASALFLALALDFFCRGVMGRKDGERPGIPPMLVVGGSIAIAFAVKESGVVLLAIPLGWIALVAIRGRWSAATRDAWMLVGGFTAVLAVEALLFRATTGQWYSSLANLLVPPDFSGLEQIQGRTPLARLRTLYRLLGPHTAWVFVLAAASSIELAVRWWRRGLSMPEAVAWLGVVGFWAWPTFYFTFGTASLSAYAFPSIQQRYYAPCIVPAAMLAVRLLAVVAAQLVATRRRALMLVVLALTLLCSAPYLERHQRGLIYGAAAKEALELAVHDAKRRFPGVPVLDSDSGWTTDLNRCRALLMADVEGGRSRVLQAIRSGDDLRGRFGYSDLASVRSPVLVLGHGAFLSGADQGPWTRDLSARIARGELAAEHVGRYRLRPWRELKGLLWLPRQEAVRRSMRRSGRDGALHDAAVDVSTGARSHTRPPDALSIVDLYLVTRR